MSAGRVGELRALHYDPLHLTLHSERVALFPDVIVLPKVVSAFHLQASIHLSMFFPHPQSPEDRQLHTLDVRHAFLFYLNRMANSRKDSNVFVSYVGPCLGHAVFSQRLLKCIVESIELCCLLAKKPLPGLVQAHSTRAMAGSAVSLRGRLLHGVCNMATWSSLHIFMRHYALNIQLQSRALLGKNVLQSVF